MLKLKYYTKFKKDYKRAMKRGLSKDLLEEVIRMLSQQQPLPAKYKDHYLINFDGKQNVRECHIQPDWLLIYEINESELILGLLRTGTHSDLLER